MSSKEPKTIEQLAAEVRQLKTQYDEAVKKLGEVVAILKETLKTGEAYARVEQTRMALETARSALKNAQNNAPSSSIFQKAEVKTAQEPLYAVVKEKDLESHQAKVVVRNAKGTVVTEHRAEQGFYKKPEPQFSRVMGEPLTVEGGFHQRQAPQYAQVIEPTPEEKQQNAIQKQLTRNDPLITIINDLRKANQTYLDSYAASGKGGTKEQTPKKFRFSPLADTSAKFQHAKDRDKELERLQIASKTLPFNVLKSKLEAHLKEYQQQEKQDRAWLGGGKVQTMLDKTQKALGEGSKSSGSHDQTKDRRPKPPTHG